MKHVNVIEGVMGIVQKLSSITASLVNKVKSIGNLHIEVDKEKALGQVVGDVRKELVELEEGIKGLDVAEQVRDHVQDIDETAQAEQTDTKNLHYRGKRARMMDNIIYFDSIPSVVKIEKRPKDELLQDKVVDFKEMCMAKNKGSILPLHRCVNFITERGNVHQRAPTWKLM